MNVDIPIYRAKVTDSEEYVEGYLVYSYGSGNIGDSAYIEGQVWYDDIGYDTWQYEIDLSTLSIHFSDMIDKQGNKIFASLSENGKGGDICEWSFGGARYKGLCLFKDTKVLFKDNKGFINYFDYCEVHKTTGIHT